VPGFLFNVVLIALANKIDGVFWFRIAVTLVFVEGPMATASDKPYPEEGQ
jgi:hypothetical protein